MIKWLCKLTKWIWAVLIMGEEAQIEAMHRSLEAKMNSEERLEIQVKEALKLRKLLELRLRELTLKSQMDSLVLVSIGVGEEAFKKLPHLGELQRRIIEDYKLFRGIK